MSLPKTYKKVVVIKKTTTWEEATKVVEVPMPQIAADEVLVKVIYAGVEASDIVQVAGGYGPLATAEPASIPDGTAQIGDIGCEGAGTVVAVGSEVKHLKAGDHVLFGGFGIAFREYLPLKAMLAIPIPALSPEIVAMAISGPTAEAFIQRYPIKEGDVALVTAAAGGTGHMAVQLLKEKGCHVIGTTSSDEKVETLKKLGVDRPVNYKKEKLADVLAKEYPKGINIIYEAVCAEDMFPVLVSNLAEGGTLVFIGSVGRDYTKAPHPINVDLNSLLFKSATVTSIFLGTPFIIQQLPAYLGALFQKWSSGKLKVLVDPTPFVGLESGVTQAQAHIRSGKNNGKVVVKIQEP